MRMSKILKEVIKKEGNTSITFKKIVKLKNSKEFSYLVDKPKGK